MDKFSFVEFLGFSLLIELFQFIKQSSWILYAVILDGTSRWSTFQLTHIELFWLRFIIFLLSGHLAWVLYQKLPDLLQIAFSKSFSHAVLLSGLHRISSIVKRYNFWHSWFIIYIEHIVIESFLKVLITSIVFRLALCSSSFSTLSDHISYFHPFVFLPHIGFRHHSVSENSNLPFFFALHCIYIKL